MGRAHLHTYISQSASACLGVLPVAKLKYLRLRDGSKPLPKPAYYTFIATTPVPTRCWATCFLLGGWPSAEIRVQGVP